MSKRIFSVIFIAIFASAFCLGLAACGGANSEKNIKLTFIVDGVVYHSVEINGDEEIALPDNPVKGGHVFKGWFFDKDTWNNQYTGGMQITEDTTLYQSLSPRERHSRKSTNNVQHKRERSGVHYKQEAKA